MTAVSDVDFPPQFYVPEHEDEGPVDGKSQRAVAQRPTHTRVFLGELRKTSGPHRQATLHENLSPSRKTTLGG